jgi:hypothetical protein
MREGRKRENKKLNKKRRKCIKNENKKHNK